MGINIEWYNKAKYLLEQNDYETLITFVKNKLSEEENATLYFLLFKATRCLERNEQSVFYINRAIDLDKNNNDYKLWYLIYLLENKDKEYESYLKFIKKDSLSHLANSYYKLLKLDYNGALNDAVKSFDDSVDANESMIAKVNALSFLNINDSELKEIINETNSFNDTRIKKSLLRLLYKNCNFDELNKYAKKCISKYPNSSLSDLANELVRKSKKHMRDDDFQGHEARNTNTYKKDVNLLDALDGLNSLIGLGDVKKQVDIICKSVQYEKEREARLGKSNLNSDRSYHFVFSGNPGTGKTTVARYFADIFKALGVIEKGQLVETDRSGLVGQYIGETALKTSKKIEEALGGVLFIDEAYSLYKGADDNKDFGKEAIDTIVKALEDHRNEFIVIMAGYRDEMKNLMKSNPGLESRFNKFIEFSDYSEEELLLIAQKIAKDNGYAISDDGILAFKQLVRAEMVTDKFGNARTVRNIINNAMERKAVNTNATTATKDELSKLFAQDFNVNLKENPEDRAQELLDELQKLVGLDDVKDNINDLINTIKYQKMEEERTGIKENLPCLHMAFLGNPGTGKTTVARIYGKLLKELGVIAKGDMYEVSRQDLVGQHLGETALITKEKCKDAYGGILFIDEAYSLCNNANDSFGLESINVLIKEMEDNRDKLIVILAGYSKEMKQFFNSNSGLESRISEKIVFTDYNDEELTEIFKTVVDNNRKTIDDDALSYVKEYFKKVLCNKPENFGNGREARNIYDRIDKMLKKRVINDKNISGDAFRRIISEDVINALGD